MHVSNAALSVKFECRGRIDVRSGPKRRSECSLTMFELIAICDGMVAKVDIELEGGK